ncbi:MAG: phosphoglycerate mutase family protein [Rikenellaceae bacterium]|nr:phosphoglycerate mutase family protein [Rikenellaceae bacterium]
MKKIPEHIAESASLTERAKKIIEELRIVEILEDAGAEVNLVGSLRMGLLSKHQDIDFHIYTDTLDVEESYNMIGKLASDKRVEKVLFGNLADTDEHCFEWHLWCRDECDSLWQIDIIQILKGSTSDGYFEKIADEIASSSSPEQKDTIIRLKYETPEEEKIMGIEYYAAVIKDGVRNYAEFTEWRKNHKFEGIFEW